uniref:Uncharacterized protein n=1 Tax=Arundo donax TaxID=35708 RepID=A0A0A8Y7X9_ARUDO
MCKLATMYLLITES